MLFQRDRDLHRTGTLVTGVWQSNSGRATLTFRAFETQLPGIDAYALTVMVLFPGLSSIGAWLIFDDLPMVMGIPEDQALMYSDVLLAVAPMALVSTRDGYVILSNYRFGPVYVNG